MDVARHGWINEWDTRDSLSVADWDCLAWRGWTIGPFHIKQEGPFVVEDKWC
jgi:hypothetical protein